MPRPAPPVPDTYRAAVWAGALGSLLVLAALPAPVPAVAQEREAGETPRGRADAVPRDTFADPTARSLLRPARARWQAMEREILSYEALVQHRFRAGIRTPLKDRTVFRSEASSRVYWSAGGETVVQALGAREADPTGVKPPDELSGVLDEAFDPGGDRIYFGVIGPDEEIDDDFWVEHPLAPGSEDHYRYRTGDTLTVSLADGRRLQAVELQVIPREGSPRLLSGSLWIEPGNGALVRAVSRLARNLHPEEDTGIFEEDPELDRIPGLFRPIEFDLSLVTVEYSLWNFRYWLPRFWRIEGMGRAGIVKAPAAYEVSYRVLDVEGAESETDLLPSRDAAEVAEEWRAESEYGEYEQVAGERKRDDRRIYLLAPVDRERLHDPEKLPPPVGEDAPTFASEGELRGLYERLAEVPAPPVAERVARPRLDWGFDRADLVRYNRVEGLSVGARVGKGVTSPVGPLDLAVTGRLGVPDLVPSGRLRVGWSSPLRSVEVSVHHRVTEVDERSRSLGPGNSATALLFGRDDGDYFRATGVAASLGPAPTDRPWWSLDLSTERHTPLAAEVDFSLPDLWGDGGAARFRPNVAAEEGWEHAAAVTLRPWWGSESEGAQGGLELFVQGAAGDFEYARTRLDARTALPLFAQLRAGLEVGAGTAWGDPPIQRHWFLGGARTLRGYGGASAVGTSYLRGRTELSRGAGVMRIAVFGDAGWAGERGAFDPDDALLSAGVGVSVLDGLVRLDLARALRAPEGWRLELYVDAVL